MNYNYSVKPITIILFFMCFSFIYAQNKTNFWAKLDTNKTKQISRKIIPTKEVFFQLNLEDLKNVLKGTGARNLSSSIILEFPNSKGELNKYKVFETPVMEPEFQARYPNNDSPSSSHAKN